MSLNNTLRLYHMLLKVEAQPDKGNLTVRERFTTAFQENSGRSRTKRNQTSSDGR